MKNSKIKFEFNIYKKINNKKVENFNIIIYRVSLNSAKNYINKKYANFCIERV